MLKFGNAFQRTIWFASYTNILKLRYVRGFELTWLSIKQQCEVFGRDCADIFFFRLKTSFWCLENCPWKVRWRQRQIESGRHIKINFISNGHKELIYALICLPHSLQENLESSEAIPFARPFTIIQLSLYHMESLIFGWELMVKIHYFIW